MEVILLGKVQGLGELGDQVKVKAGYGRNYLIPGKMAVPATPDNIAKFEGRRAELEQAQESVLAAAQRRAEGLQGISVTIPAKAGGEGKLFGSIGTVDIAEAVTGQGVELEKREIRLPDGPLREVGEHEVELHLHADVNAKITVIVVADAEPTE